MPMVSFTQPFYDGETHYPADGKEHFVPEGVTLPTRDIKTIDGEPFKITKAAKDPSTAKRDEVKEKSAEERREAEAKQPQGKRAQVKRSATKNTKVK